VSVTTAPRSTAGWVEPAVAVLFSAALFAGARQGRYALLVVVAALQLGAILAFAATRPANTRGVVTIGLLVAAAADTVALHTRSLDPLAGVVGLSVLATIVVQLTRGVARARVTEAMAASVGLGLGVVAVATLLVLRGQSRGPTICSVAALAAGVAVLVTAVVDRVRARSAGTAGSDRRWGAWVIGSLAVAVIGALVTGAAAARVAEPWLTRPHGAALGAAVGLAAALASLAAHVGAAEAWERPAGIGAGGAPDQHAAGVEAPGRSVASLVAGPLAAFVAAAPVAYLLAGLARR
jgi:hypothetical protein